MFLWKVGCEMLQIIKKSEKNAIIFDPYAKNLYPLMAWYQCFVRRLVTQKGVESSWKIPKLTIN